MADKKISELTELTTPDGTEELVVNDSGVSKKVQIDNLIADNGLSGNKIDGGTISNFTSTGIDDNATSTAITIDASENVGIGTTSPTKNLHLSVPNPSTVGATMRLENRNLSAVAGTPIGTIDFYSNDADGAHISSFIKGIAQEAYGRTGALTFGVSQSYTADATEAMRIDSAGDVKVNTGNLVIGTAGKGIDFSASADTTTGTVTSQVLDDYEEGTFTPVMTGATSGTVNGSGKYTKVGNLVTIYAGFGDIGTGLVGAITVTGMPFVFGSDIAPFSTFINYLAVEAIAVSQGGGTFLNIRKHADGIYDNANIDGSILGTFTDIYISGSHTV